MPQQSYFKKKIVVPIPLHAQNFSLVTSIHTHFAAVSLQAPQKGACAKADFTITTCICCVLDLTSLSPNHKTSSLNQVQNKLS